MCLGIPLALAGIVLLLMRSPLIGHIVSSQIQDLTGCALEGTGATGAYIDLTGRLIVNHFRVVLPGVPGDAGTVLSAERATIDLDWTGILTGHVTPSAIRLAKPVFRVSQSVDDGELNIGAIAGHAASRPRPKGKSGGTPPPRIDVIDGTLVLSEHARGTGEPTTLREMHVSGSLFPADQAGEVYVIRFAENGVSRDKAMLFDGKVNLESGAAQFKLYNIALGSWKPESVPGAFRDLWRRMNVRGRIPSASMTYDKQEGTKAEITLDNVAMNALIPSEDATSDAMKDMGLRDVSGVVRFSSAGLSADLTGKLENQRGESSVKLTTKGLDVNAALSCEIVARRVGLARDTELLPYIPDRAKEYLRLFSGPTGELDARVRVSRGEPVNGQAAPIRVSGGRVVLRHGSAAFARFPYPFAEMAGTIEFDDRAVHILEITGKGPTGATLQATGLITPLTDEAMVDVNVHCEHVPVDKYLLDAMPPDRRHVLENVFSRPEYERLIADGLVRDPSSPASSANAGAPEFALAGDAVVDVHVHTPEGKDAPWYTIVDIQFEHAGMLVDPFPLPVIATNVKLHVTDDEAKLVSGTFRPLSGGTMDLAAGVTFFNNGRRETRPDVRITAADVPADRLLLHALPRDEEPSPAGSGHELALGDLMRRLNVSGTLGCTAQVTADPESSAARSGENGGSETEPKIAYDVLVDLSKAKAAPALPGERAAFSIEDLLGTVRVTRTSLSVPGLTGRLYRLAAGDGAPAASAGSPDGAQVGPDPGAGLAITLERQLGSENPQDGRMDGSIAVTGANLEAPFERLVGVFSPETGHRLAELREQHRPSGRLETTVRLRRPAGKNAATDFGVTLDNATYLEFSALNGRVGIDWPEGLVEVLVPAEGPQQLRFDGVRARLTLDGANCGDARVHGSVTLDPITSFVAAPADLVADFADWRFESPVIVPLLNHLTGRNTAAAYQRFNAVGPFDATIRVQTEPGATPPNSVASVAAELMPKSMAFNWEGQRVVCNEVSGKVTLRSRAGSEVQAVSGRFDALSVKTPNWDARADGDWYASAYGSAPGAERPVQLALTFGITGRTLDPALRALVPPTAVDAIDGLDAEFRGPFSLRDGVVRTTLGDAPSPTTFTGTLEFNDLAFSAGVPIDHCNGHVDIHVDSRPPGSAEPTKFRVAAHADTLRIAGVSASTADALVTSGDQPGQVVIPEIVAQCYGGRLLGNAALDIPDAQPAQGGVGGGGAAHARYRAELVLAGVPLAPVLADAAVAGGNVPDPGPIGPSSPSGANASADPSRGEIDARLSLSGIAGDLSSRSGSGVIRVANGDILKLPLMLPLIQVSNFQIPSNDRLGYLQSDFTVRGDTAHFNHISLLSKSVTILGAGTLKWPDLVLDMKFNSRSNARIPVISGVFEALRNEIVSTTVRGKLSAPIVRQEPFTGTRELIDRLINPGAYVEIPPNVRPSGPSGNAQPTRSSNGGSETTVVPNQP